MDIREKKYSIEETAKALDKSPKTIQAWVAENRIGVYRIGRSIRIGESEINRILTEGFTPARHIA